MNKIYGIEVDCVACAAKMESAIAAVEGIREATISFMTQKLKIEFDEEAEEKSVMKKVVKVCKKVEPDCEIDV